MNFIIIGGAIVLLYTLAGLFLVLAIEIHDGGEIEDESVLSAVVMWPILILIFAIMKLEDFFVSCLRLLRKIKKTQRKKRG